MTDSLATLLQALHADPGDATAWLALADALEEAGQPRRAELVRLSRSLRTLALDEQRHRNEARLRELIASGVDPCVPTLTNSIGMELALIPAGEFWMGSPPGQPDRHPDEGPLHEVQISRPFYLGVYAVTQAQYREVMGRSDGYFTPAALAAVRAEGLEPDRFPVAAASWEDCTYFCDFLLRHPEEQEAKRRYRLPTEAEWEYACRAGTNSPFHVGHDLSSAHANFDGNQPYGRWEKGTYLGRPVPVGSYRLNAFGLYDMHGNVWEWCADWADAGYYAVSPRRDPPGPAEGRARILRGGNWSAEGLRLRSASRAWDPPGACSGFRVVLEHPGGA